MKYLVYAHSSVQPLVWTALRWILGRATKITPPGLYRVRALLHLRRWGILALWAVGLIAQAVMLVMLAELVDLCISLAELWTELARKHLEITLSR